MVLVLSLCVDNEVRWLTSSPQESLLSGPSRLGDRWRLKYKLSVHIVCVPPHFLLGYVLISPLYNITDMDDVWEMQLPS
jgi:hypothetical protein